MTGAASYEVLAIRYATRTGSRAEMFLNHHVYGEPDGPIDMDFYLWVARNEQHTVVIDTGYAAAGPTKRKQRTELAEPMAALAALGVRPEDAPQVIATHAHYDHIGNLAAFPESEIVMGRAEFDFWTGPYAGRRQFAYTTEAAELAHLGDIRDQGRATFVDRAVTVAPGIEVVPVGGHTPGQLVVLVAVEGGQAILTSDAAHFYEEIELDRPFTYLTDLADTYRAYELLREMAADPGRVLVAGHDPDVLRRFPLLDGAGGQVARVTP
ncbi:MBL fold metallo-hydrolase [Acrocarpospora corrugata]|uniref:MBL fold metallo-hydrolase n=1 Tax=Acrocarpospora corrugata TaxID=35763 RepID=A0A5M3W2R1_9ACTN|nr:N-acyl homoserine lactonase family protein [Acrocarpospora corrugata]GES00888.1 MBL fold metallo-hydrolase [Acrocarpospora corrugata]